MKQSTAVHQATHSVLDEHGLSFEDGGQITDVITKELRSQVIDVVTAGIEAGEVDFSDEATAKYNTTKLVRGYVSGMVSNWYRKDKRFNGNTVYQPANPGSRTGMSDPEIKNLKLLLKSGKLDDKQSLIAQARIDEKTTEIRASKAQVAVDFTAIPADLLASLGIESNEE